MEITLSRKMILVASCLMLVACAGETRAQQDSAVKDEAAVINQGDLSLEQKCEQLSKETGKNYEVVSGVVLKSGITPPPPGDCFTDECVRQQLPVKTSSFFIIQSADSSEKNSYVYSQEELLEIVKNKSYVHVDKNYHFCALELKEFSQYHGGKKVYKLYSNEMIQEVK